MSEYEGGRVSFGTEGNTSSTVKSATKPSCRTFAFTAWFGPNLPIAIHRAVSQESTTNQEIEILQSGGPSKSLLLATVSRRRLR